MDKQAIDIRITNFINKVLNFYIRKRELNIQLSKNKNWEKNFKTSEYFIHKLDDNLSIKLYKDSYLSKLIYDKFEVDEIDFVNKYLKEGDTFLDIGANVGLFSLYASKKVGSSGNVIAFEPAYVTHKRLLENCELNKLSNVRPFKLGLSNENTTLELNISSNGFEAWNTFVKSNDNKFSSKESVEVNSLDYFLSQNSIDTDKISLIKLDVEGFEINVLEGASALLANENAPVFMVEFTDDNAIAAGHCCHEIYKLLNRYGYTWYTYDAAKNKLIFDPMRPSYPYNNLIAVKNISLNPRLSGFLIS